MRIIFVPQLISSKCSHFLCLFWTGVSSSFQFVKEIWTSNLLWPHTQCLAGHSQDTLPQKQGSFQSNVFFVAKSQWRWGKRWRLWVTRIYGWRRGKWLYDSIGKNVCRNVVYTLYYMCIYIYILNVYTYIYICQVPPWIYVNDGKSCKLPACGMSSNMFRFRFLRIKQNCFDESL